MASPTFTPYRRSSFLIQQDEPAANPLAARGTNGHGGGGGTLASLIRTRSVVSLHSRDEEEAVGMGSSSNAVGVGVGVGRRGSGDWDDERRLSEERRMSAILNAPQMRSMRLIGNSNPRYRWERYWKTDEQLGKMKSKKIRKYYERTNYLIRQYLYIDRLLDSSLPHDLLNEYNNMPAWAFRGIEVPDTITEESPTADASRPGGEDGNHGSSSSASSSSSSPAVGANTAPQPANASKKVKRTPRDIYRPTETTPLFFKRQDEAVDSNHEEEDEEDEHSTQRPKTKPEKKKKLVREDGANDDYDYDYDEGDYDYDDDEDGAGGGGGIVATAIYVNFAANTVLLAGKIAVVATVPSVSVLASLVDALLDFLSTAIVWLTTWLIGQQDQYKYPVGRRRLEPLGVLVFSVIMITSFVQVALEAVQRLLSSDHEIIGLTIPAILIMVFTVVIKGLCWLWLRFVKISSVQALAADAITDVIFNAGSIAFPLVGFAFRIWWLDALGGLLLSIVVIFNWSQTSMEHIKNLSGFSATADQRNILLYLTMRFAKTIRKIQGLQAYHAGDKLNVEVDIVLDASTSLKDSHDLSESLQYVLESVPIVDRAFVHVDYASYNLPTHMEQQAWR